MQYKEIIFAFFYLLLFVFGKIFFDKLCLKLNNKKKIN